MMQPHKFAPQPSSGRQRTVLVVVGVCACAGILIISAVGIGLFVFISQMKQSATASRGTEQRAEAETSPFHVDPASIDPFGVMTPEQRAEALRQQQAVMAEMAEVDRDMFELLHQQSAKELTRVSEFPQCASHTEYLRRVYERLIEFGCTSYYARHLAMTEDNWSFYLFGGTVSEHALAGGPDRQAEWRLCASPRIDGQASSKIWIRDPQPVDEAFESFLYERVVRPFPELEEPLTQVWNDVYDKMRRMIDEVAGGEEYDFEVESNVVQFTIPSVQGTFYIRHRLETNRVLPFLEEDFDYLTDSHWNIQFVPPGVTYDEHFY